MDLTRTIDYKDVLEDCYSSDPEFLDKYHDTPGAGIENCVKRDFEMFAKTPGYMMHDVTENGVRIGYFGIDPGYSPPLMLGFFVKPQYRKKEHLFYFWENIKNNFPGDFLVSCSPNNAPAIKYIINRGAEVFLEHHKFIAFKIKN